MFEEYCTKFAPFLLRNKRQNSNPKPLTSTKEHTISQSFTFGQSFGFGQRVDLFNSKPSAEGQRAKFDLRWNTGPHSLFHMVAVLHRQVKAAHALES